MEGLTCLPVVASLPQFLFRSGRSLSEALRVKSTEPSSGKLC